MTRWSSGKWQGQNKRPELSLIPTVNLLCFGGQCVYVSEIELQAHRAWLVHSPQVGPGLGGL